MVVLLVVVGLVVAGLQTLPIGTEPLPGATATTGATATPTDRSTTSPKTSGVGKPELTDSPLYRQKLSGSCPTTVGTISSRTQYKKQVTDLIGCLETLYHPIVDAAGGSYRKVQVTYYDTSVESRCGGQTDAYAFYCESDGTVYFSNQVYADAQYARLAVADVVIHEYGHHVQAMMDFFEAADELDEKRAITVRRQELQVFCWTYYAFANVPSFKLTDTDREFFLDVWGDTSDAEGHGSVKAQQYWGARGLSGENLGACNTWAVGADKVK
ncbi:neutral zinc metallopeptidase [Micropruina sp.]|uniref:neutral zinc metallopeptidase n=1 Tax=Micropruina sp. TaxID=2737536 RepID=UPI0039E5BC84